VVMSIPSLLALRSPLWTVRRSTGFSKTKLDVPFRI
jgi:hypothetical protein